jgi:hypothetical protein
MSWHAFIVEADKFLRSSGLHSSEKIISLIKRVNPTSLDLTESEKIRGYELKGELQNLLLENYGDSFVLSPHPFNPDIVLIKHRFLPSIDACHADVKSLSTKAFSSVASPDDNQNEHKAQKLKTAIQGTVPNDFNSSQGLLRRAQALLETYDYEAVVETLGKIRLKSAEELPVLLKAVRVLLDETGSFQAAASLITAQPPFAYRDKCVRELLAITYSSNAMIPEARAVFESIPIQALSKESLLAYADIALKDGNLLLAYNLLRTADNKEGFVNKYPGLKTEIENKLLTEIEPLLHLARQQLAANEFDRVCSYAREALRSHPDCSEALALIGFVEAIRVEDEIKKLWSMFENTSGSEARLDILKKLKDIDHSNERKIRSLITSEKHAARDNSIRERVVRLQEYAEKRDWEHAFSDLLWLLRQDAILAPFEKICDQIPVYSVFLKNQNLQRLSDRKVKVAWFLLHDALLQNDAGHYDSCFTILSSIKTWFNSYPVFSRLYRDVATRVQQASRTELNRLQEAMNSNSCTVTDAARLRETARLLIQKIEPSLRAEYRSFFENRLLELKPQTPEELLLEEYSKALLLGNTSTAEQLRQKNPHVSFDEVTERIALQYSIQTDRLYVTTDNDIVLLRQLN